MTHVDNCHVFIIVSTNGSASEDHSWCHCDIANIEMLLLASSEKKQMSIVNHVPDSGLTYINGRYDVAIIANTMVLV